MPRIIVKALNTEDDSSIEKHTIVVSDHNLSYKEKTHTLTTENLVGVVSEIVVNQLDTMEFTLVFVDSSKLEEKTINMQLSFGSGCKPQLQEYITGDPTGEDSDEYWLYKYDTLIQRIEAATDFLMVCCSYEYFA